MITLYPYGELGFADHGWLKARHHFSFASYQNPNRIGFGVLRVINDDIIAAGRGFAPHSHSDMEIITYVRQGAITHKDSNGNEGRTEAGNVQVMSAGSGITHSEYNLEDKDTNIYQIWIEPRKYGVKPTWDCANFPNNPVETGLNLLVSGDGKAPLFINQDAMIYAGKIKKGKLISHKIHGQAYLLVSKGSVALNEVFMNSGDGAEVENVSNIKIMANKDAEILVIDVPKS